uniref:NADH dehydrogenase subunit 6 n=1 Tax=Pseudoleptodeira latifasciata TaxID=427734 RepID=C5H4V0_PSEUZ|nr:NADH dehydrogenase subunit 6 [Pseudoleptodeira latifasciata]ACD77327.1 NADH dehydrogenase subunit 6 [Pseudoleptodeira latifasciata]
MSYLFGMVLVFMVFSVLVLGVTVVPYHGVVVLMGISFFCCIFMVMLGRTFSALIMYIVYLGGLIVVFSYCVSIEKDEVDIHGVVKFKYFVVFMFILIVGYLWWALMGGVEGLLVYVNWEDLVCLEVNGSGVFYFGGGLGLLVCSWGLLVVLFSILVILSWSRLGGFRSF